MKKLKLTFAVFVFGALFSLILGGSMFYSNVRRNELLAAQVCKLISNRAQVGALRDAYDQAFSVSQVSQAMAFLSLKEGSISYGNAPEDRSGFQAEECLIEGRPDLSVTFFFKKYPIEGFNPLIAFLCFSLGVIFAGIGFNLFSLRLVQAAKLAIERGVDGSHAGSVFERSFSKVVEATPAIRRLKEEVSEKAKVLEENKTFKSRILELRDATALQSIEKKSMADLLGQLRHDIQSPLSFLRTFSLVEHRADNWREMHALAVEKVGRMVNELGRVEGAEIIHKSLDEVALLECVLHECILSKKVLWQPRVSVAFSFKEESLNLVPIEEAKLARVIENLLQNAYESISSVGSIEISVNRLGNLIELQIADTGKGIPADVLDRLGKEKITFGKRSGNGIGLFTAVQWIKAWGGELNISSEVGRGTNISIKFPRFETEAKFTADISGFSGQRLIVVDDEERYANALIAASSAEGRHFSSIASYVGWLESEEVDLENQISVFDQHLNPGSGLDLLRIHPWPNRSVLYTSDYLNREAISLSSELGFTILPKQFLV